MSFKRILLWATGVVLVLAILVISHLPVLVELAVKTSLKDELNQYAVGFNLRQLGMFQTRLAEFTLGEDVRVDEIRMGYVPGRMADFKLETCRILGLEVNARVTREGIRVSRFFLPLGKGVEDSSSTGSGFNVPPLLPGRVVLENARLNLFLDLPELGRQRLSIPIQAKALLNGETQTVEVGATLELLGQPIQVELKSDFHGGLKSLVIQSRGFDLAVVSPWLQALPFQLSGYSHVKIAATDLNEAQIHLSKIGLRSGNVETEFKDVALTLKRVPGKIAVQGNWQQSAPLIGKIPIQLTGHWPMGEKPGPLGMEVKATLPRAFEFEDGTNRVTVNGPELTLNLKGRPNHLQGRLRVNTEGVKIQSHAATLDMGVSTLDFPFVHPFNSGRVPSGTLKLGKVTATLANGQKLKVRPATVHLSRKKAYALAFKGELAPELGRMPSLGITGEIHPLDPVKFQLNLHCPEFLLDSGMLAQYLSALPLSLSFSGRVAGDAELAWGPGGLSGAAKTRFAQGEMNWPDFNLSAKGIQGEIQLRDILNPASLPGQILTMDQVDMGAFKITDTRIRYTLEPEGKVLLENARFSWCRGLVSTESVRVPADDGKLDLILYCDRLKLADLLNQMGGFSAEGEGTVSGRLPVVYDQGHLSFDQGFLFSTPGQGGKVRVENTESLIQGIPVDTPQFAQLDLTREALKDFEYKWARLNLNSSGETLTAALQLDGKPNDLLPFVFRKELGGFARVESRAQGSRFQGITLNINLKLPFNQVMKFGKTMKQLMNP